MPSSGAGLQSIDADFGRLLELLSSLPGPMELPAKDDPLGQEKIKKLVSPGALRVAHSLSNDDEYRKLKEQVPAALIDDLEKVRAEVSAKLGHVLNDSRVAPLIEFVRRSSDREPIDAQIGRPTRISWEHSLRLNASGRVRPFARVFILHSSSVIADFTADWDELVFAARSFLRCLDLQSQRAQAYIDDGKIDLSDAKLDSILGRLNDIQGYLTSLRTKFEKIHQDGGFQTKRSKG